MPITSRIDRPARRKLRLSNDVVFKALFCRQPHLLSDLINTVRHPAAPVSIVHILNPLLVPDAPAGKQVVFDIRARDADGQQFIVEMQMRRHADWPARSVYYMARGLAEQLRSGEDYDVLQPSIGITLIGQDWYTRVSDQADWRFTLRDSLRPSIEFDQALQLYVVELHKAEILQQGPSALMDWVVCLSHYPDEDIMRQITHPPALEALKHLESMCSEEELRIIAMQREFAAMDERVARRAAEKKGQQRVLKRQLTHRFGALPTEIEDKLSKAKADQLTDWAVKLLDARTMEEVFV
ncbi:Rpn family recombination-promoting nuclease/putative transposase [Bordetella genomosp. 13]|uniref:Rpn family recombination-promoting nuclease/putative transposase n=1 Tax=Bordetella genomosp. 13 TaxID=463040 RepID=UPI0011A933CF|nr:Rpn family recombination-promoting nuclease/putative transposase [Bordetella genomosp. 13]